MTSHDFKYCLKMDNLGKSNSRILSSQQLSSSQPYHGCHLSLYIKRLLVFFLDNHSRDTHKRRILKKFKGTTTTP